MSYRTCVEGVQIFGNNESYLKWLDFIKESGIEVDEEGMYDGYITDITKAMRVLEEIVFDIEASLNKRDISIFDLSSLFAQCSSGQDDLFFELYELVENGYLFIPFNFYRAVEHKLDGIFDINIENEKMRVSFSLKKGEKVHVRAS